LRLGLALGLRGGGLGVVGEHPVGHRHQRHDDHDGHDHPHP
jgi:hypothetical protein